MKLSKLSLFLPLYFLAACSKETSKNPEPCTPVLIVSDKYTIDTVYLRTDTLYKSCLSGHWLSVHKAQKDTETFNLCDPSYNFRLERLRYGTGNLIAPIYKK